MADEQQIILEINVKDSLTKTAELKASINELIAQRQQLAEAAKKGDEDAAKGLEAVNVAVRLQQQEYRTQTKILDGYVASKKSEVDTLKFANNSIQQNRDLLKQLTAQYITLKSPSSEATKQIKDLSDALKSQEAAIGNTTRNVGNYREAFTGAFRDLQGVGKVIDPIKNMGLAFESAGGGVKGFGLALATTGLPLFIAGLNSLINVFKAYEPVAEAVERTTAGIGAAFSALVRGNDILETAKQTAELTGQLQDLQDEQSLFDLRNAQGRKEVIRLLLESKNAGLSLNEQIAAVRKANKLEAKESAEQLEQLRNQAKIEEELFAVRVGIREKYTKSAGDKLIEDLITTSDYRTKNIMEQLAITNDDIKALRDRRKAIIESEAESQNLQDRLRNREQALLDKFNAKAAKDEADKQALRDKANAQKEKDAARELANQKEIAVENEKIRLDEKAAGEKEISDLAKKNQDKINEDEKAAKDSAALREKQGLDYLKQRQDEADKEVAIEKQKQADINSIVGAGFKFATDLINTIGNELQKSNDERLKNETKANDERKDSYKASLEAGLISKKQFNKLTAESDAKLEAETRKQNEKAWEANKAIQITMAVINTAQAIIAQLSNPTPYVGFVLSALAAATGAVQIGIIASQQPPKFAKGVIGLDGKGTETSDDIPAYLSKGESVVTAKATRRFHRELAAMEMAVGNSPNYNFGKGMFASGFIPTIEGDGGFSARDISNRIEQSAMLQEAIRNGFALVPAPRLSIVEFEGKQNNRNRSVNISEA